MIAWLPDSDPFPWLELLGRTHPLVLHLPLGLIPAMTLLEFGAAVLRRDCPRGAVLALAWFTAVTAGLATASGLLLADEGGYTGDTAGNHKIAGIALAVLCLLAAIAACFRGRTAFRLVLLLALAVMVPTGHLGGSLTHGENFLFEPLHRHDKKRTVVAPPPDDGSANTDGVPTPPPANHFTAVIAPIFERTCNKCHNEEKTKGELLLTTKAGILAGGENGVVVVPGKPDDSELLLRLLLPMADEFHMPPEGKPQPTADEIAALRAWIADGCKFD